MSAYRKYLDEEKKLSFDFESALPSDLSLPELFAELTRRLEAKYHINRGLLVIKNRTTNCFSAISTWAEGELRDGLLINLPSDQSLFEKVAEDGQTFTEEFSGLFSGNFFERKLLLDDNSSCYALQPLKHEGQVLGMLGYSSHEPLSFTMFEQGALNDIGYELGEIIRTKMLNGELG